MRILTGSVRRMDIPRISKKLTGRLLVLAIMQAVMSFLIIFSLRVIFPTMYASESHRMANIRGGGFRIKSFIFQVPRQQVAHVSELRLLRCSGNYNRW